MAEVMFRSVGKTYGKKAQAFQAVQDLSFRCRDGDFFAILGPSGCGKTSTLRMLAGLEEISQGEVCIGERRVNELSSRERNVAMSFENYGLYPDFTVFENIAYPLRIRKTADAQVQEQVRSIARKLRLLGVLSHKPAALSSGQKQRVSIARALVRNPDVTIMDEPLSHLDARMRSNMRSIIKRLHHQLGLTTIYVTHDQIEAMTMADQILIMDRGRMQQIGTPDQVYYRPANVFVAGFIGTPQMNLLDGQIYLPGGEAEVSCGNAFTVDASRYRGRAEDGMRVTFGVRPHDVAVSRSAQTGYAKGSVYVVEALGESTILTIKAGDALVKSEQEGHLTDWSFDDDIYFHIDPSDIHLFRADGGERIVPENEAALL